MDPRIYVAALTLLSLTQLALPLLISPTLIRGDGVGYYAWLRSSVIDGDLDFEDEFEHFQAALPDSVLMSTLHLEGPRTSTGLVPNHWPAGTAVLWSPFFLAAHGIAGVFGLSADGYGLHYQTAIVIGSALYGLLGLLFLFKILRRFYPIEASVLALLSVWGASSLTAYMYFMPAWSHTSSFFAVSLLIWLWLRARERSGTRDFFALGAVCGLITTIRHQDVLFGVLLALECLRRWGSSGYRLGSIARIALAALAGGLLASLPQLVGWQILYDRPLPTAYAPGAEFTWTAPYLYDVLFAPRYGLLSSTPIFLLAFFGMPLLWQRDKVIAAALAGVFLVQLWIVASFNYYDGGAAFGPRYFISSLPLVALALAALAHRAATALGPWPGRALLAALVAWNYLLVALFGFELIPRGSHMSWHRFFQGVMALGQHLTG